MRADLLPAGRGRCCRWRGLAHCHDGTWQPFVRLAQTSVSGSKRNGAIPIATFRFGAGTEVTDDRRPCQSRRSKRLGQAARIGPSLPSARCRSWAIPFDALVTN